ncbi:MAG: hypothetical protein ACK56I_21570, partial [bacterium]
GIAQGLREHRHGPGRIARMQPRKGFLESLAVARLRALVHGNRATPRRGGQGQHRSRPLQMSWGRGIVPWGARHARDR